LRVKALRKMMVKLTQEGAKAGWDKGVCLFSSATEDLSQNEFCQSFEKGDFFRRVSERDGSEGEGKGGLCF